MPGAVLGTGDTVVGRRQSRCPQNVPVGEKEKQTNVPTMSSRVSVRRT